MDKYTFKGSWFIESFGNRMAQLQRFVIGEESELIAGVKDSGTNGAYRGSI